MQTTDALVIIDVQNDFCPGGALPVKEGDAVVQVINRYISLFKKAGRMIYATRDWHPRKTVHFREQGGKWPSHCVQGTAGAMFHQGLRLPHDTVIITKGTGNDEDSYSGFQGKDASGKTFAESLRAAGVARVFACGLATDYCVKATVLDAIGQGFRTCLLTDAVRGVDVAAGDSMRAIEEMKRSGAQTGTLDDFQAAN